MMRIFFGLLAVLHKPDHRDTHLNIHLRNERQPIDSSRSAIANYESDSLVTEVNQVTNLSDNTT